MWLLVTHFLRTGSEVLFRIEALRIVLVHGCREVGVGMNVQDGCLDTILRTYSSIDQGTLTVRRSTAVLAAALLTLSACGSNDRNSTTEQSDSQAKSEGSSSSPASSTPKGNRDPCEDETLSQKEWFDAGCMDDDFEAVDLPTIGDTEKVGNFEFTLMSVKDVGGRLEYPDYPSTDDDTTEGSVYVLTLKATNVGFGPTSIGEEITFSMFDEKGREFSEFRASAEPEYGEQFWSEELNPEESLERIVMFDLPPTAKPDMLVVLSGDEWDDEEMDSTTFEIKGK